MSLNKIILAYFTMCCVQFIYADESLEKELQQLKNNASRINFPAIPVYDITPPVYKRYGLVNHFDSTRVTNDIYTTQVTNEFNLSQLQMVGYMRDANISYAFIHTPYETLMLKVGDKIKSAVVTSINESGTTIVDNIIGDSGKTYQKIINLKFNDNNNLRLKLQ